MHPVLVVCRDGILRVPEQQVEKSPQLVSHVLIHVDEHVGHRKCFENALPILALAGLVEVPVHQRVHDRFDFDVVLGCGVRAYQLGQVFLPREDGGLDANNDQMVPIDPTELLNLRGTFQGVDYPSPARDGLPV